MFIFHFILLADFTESLPFEGYLSIHLSLFPGPESLSANGTSCVHGHGGFEEWLIIVGSHGIDLFLVKLHLSVTSIPQSFQHFLLHEVSYVPFFIR